MPFMRPVLSSLFLIVVGVVAGTLFIHAQPPGAPPHAPMGDVMTYQGKVADAQGKPVTGKFTATFQIYQESQRVFWQQMPVTAQVGVFTCLLGGTMPLPTFDAALPCEIRVQVGRFPEIRQPLASVPMALSARHAQRAHAATMLAPPVKDGSFISIPKEGQAEILISAAGFHEIHVEGTLLPSSEHFRRFPTDGWDLGSWKYRWRAGWFKYTSGEWVTTAKERLPIEDGKYGRGDVLSLGKSGLVKSTMPNDPLVQGVYDDGVKEAVTFGIYDINVIGSIKRGDFLTTSSVPGHAQASQNPQLGTIIAQTLEDFPGERGRVKAMIRKM